MRLDLFYYDLPKKFIAQRPLKQRDLSKLMILEKKSGKTTHDIFKNISKYLRAGDILVLNISKVLKCRLTGKKENGTAIECFVLKDLGDNVCLALVKPSKRLKEGAKVYIGDSLEYCFFVKEMQGYGKAIVSFNEDIYKVLAKYGEVPLPPYIKNRFIDEDRYQTVYAKTGHSAAAPTAGFHFTKKLMDSLSSGGIGFAEVNLNIGLDTFRPIIEENIEEHIIHTESYSVSETNARKINNAKVKGGRVIAVGTTATRVLETVADKDGKILSSCGDTSLYITPGYRFKAIDGIITNFHLPYSTLIVMISAFAGIKNVMDAYEEAKINGYRFYSFGDCMLIN